MNTAIRLANLVGKTGLLPIRTAAGEFHEIDFTILSLKTPVQSDDDIERAIDRTNFLVRFNEGTLVDGGNTRTISGHSIARIREHY